MASAAVTAPETTAPELTAKVPATEAPAEFIAPTTAPPLNEEPRAALRAPESPVLEQGIEIPLEPAQGELMLTVTELEQREVTCDSPPCDRFFTIRAALRNGGATPIGGIALASGLQWVNEGATLRSPEPYSKALEGESVVKLDGFILQPGKEKKLKVAVDRAVPTVPGGQFVPYLRLVASGPAVDAPPVASVQE